MEFLRYAASTLLAIAFAALIMAEFGFASMFGGWKPTHETAIAYGVLSIACSCFLKISQKAPDA